MNPQSPFGFISIFNGQSAASEAISSDRNCKNCNVLPGIGSEPPANEQRNTPQ